MFFKKEKILVCDDQPMLRNLLASAIKEFGARYEVVEAPNGAVAEELMRNNQFWAVFMDVEMPEQDGFTTLEKVRAENLAGDAPVIMCTGCDEEEHLLRGWQLKADYYLTKPFDLGELVARLHALLRRAHHSDPGSDTLTVGSLTIDTARRLVFVAGERVELTKREFDLLAALAENAGVVLSRQRLLELVWGYDFDVDTNVADVFVSYLRRKLERDGLPRVIHTVRGIGYVLREDP